jgi:hypothetical protein
MIVRRKKYYILCSKVKLLTASDENGIFWGRVGLYVSQERSFDSTLWTNQGFGTAIKSSHVQVNSHTMVDRDKILCTNRSGRIKQFGSVTPRL